MFPASPGAREEILHLLARMCDRADRLNWLVQTMVDQVGTWHGTVELRGVYCTRFRPADGIEAYCTGTPNFTALDCEAENNQGMAGADDQYSIGAIGGLLQ